MDLLPETVRERILDNIRKTLVEISTRAGYYFDFNEKTVQRWSMHGNRMIDLPMVVISPGDEEETSLLNGFEECVMSVYLDVFFINDENDEEFATDTYLSRLQGDIKKAIFIDYTRGGNAIDTDIAGTTPFETTEGQHYAGIIVELKIRYRHKRNNPTKKINEEEHHVTVDTKKTISSKD